MKKPILRVVGGVLTSLGAVGSIFVKRDVDGKYSVALAPIALAGLLGVGFTCAAQEDEPFGQCFKTNLVLLKEYVYAN